VNLNIQVSEIEKAYWVPLSKLISPEVYEKKVITINEKIKFPNHQFKIVKDAPPVWGATGAVLKNLLNRLEKNGLTFPNYEPWNESKFWNTRVLEYPFCK